MTNICSIPIPADPPREAGYREYRDREYRDREYRPRVRSRPRAKGPAPARGILAMGPVPAQGIPAKGPVPALTDREKCNRLPSSFWPNQCHRLNSSMSSTLSDLV